MFRIGLLGLGVMGKRHTEAAALVPGMEIVTREHPAYAGLPKSDVAHAMIADPAIAALDFCLPTGQHAPLTIAALAANKHVLCEKPMALTPADCEKMLAAKANSKAILMIAHVLRFWPAYEYLREVVATRAYGAIQSATLIRRCGLPTWAPWLLQVEESGGGVLDMLVHDFDQSLLLFGQPESIETKKEGPPHSIECTLHYKNNLKVEIQGGWLTGEVPFAMGYELVCQQGTLRFAESKLVFNDTEIPLKKADAYARQLAYFKDCCEQGVEPARCTPKSAAEAVTLSIHARDNARDNQVC